MTNDMRVPFGLCDITYNGNTYSNLANEAVFLVEPDYEVIGYGGVKGGRKYFLTEYNVSLELSLSNESYDTLMLSNPALQNYDNGGLYDNPTLIDTLGKPLTIHPTEAGDSREYDITLFRAYLDPAKEYERTYDKGVDEVSIRFLGNPYLSLDGSSFKSYFFIGDVAEAGIPLDIDGF